MTKKITAVLFCLVAAIFCSQPLFGQADYRVRFHDRTAFFPENFQDFQSNLRAEPGETVGGKVFRYLQFFELPDGSSREEMERLGVEFYGYNDFGAYLVGLPEEMDLKKLEKFGPRSLLSVAPDWKIAKNLRERPFGAWAMVGERIEVNVQVFPNISIREGAELCREAGMTVVFEGNQNGFLTARFFPEEIERMAALPFVQWLELVPPPGEKEDTGGRTIHRSNLMDSDAPMGKHYNAEGVAVLCRDDGQVGPHIDFQGRLTNIASLRPGQTHGDGVSGIMAGAGNLDANQKGMAAGATLYAIDYVNHFQDTTLGLHVYHDVKVTNSSYSDGCNDGYTLATQTVDRQIFQNPSLIHVFSAGNAGLQDCGDNTYGAGANWGTITGGHKMAKNAIATANLHADGALEPTSSRGPAYDGRIKPDIAAHGQDQGSTTEGNDYQVFGGTSGAAPGIAGCLAQLYHAFKTIENTQVVPAALMKATLLATANDMGKLGPDFKYGWGHVNAARALRLLEEKRWQTDAIANQAKKQIPLTVGPGIRQLKIMIYWAERQSNVNTPKALLNDLDLTVDGPTGNKFLPWILNHAANATTLDAPATKGADHLNNMEQVAIENPAPGTYNINVEGFQVPFGPQQFYLVWEILTDEIQLTYPGGGESFIPGTTERLHWDAWGTGSDFTLEFAANGVDFQQVVTLPGTARMYSWTVPNVFTKDAKMRIRRGSESHTTEHPFNLLPQPTGLKVEKVCPTSVTLSWKPVNDTLNTDIYMLGQKYMEVVGTSDTSVFDVPLSNYDGKSLWFSARASHPSGMVGRRIFGISHTGGLKNCPQPFDLGMNSIQEPSINAIVKCEPSAQQVTVRVKNEGQNPISGATASYSVDNGTPVTENLPNIAAGQVLTYAFAQQVSLSGFGNLTLRVWANHPNDLVRFNDTLARVYPIVTQPTTGYYTQNFQGVFPPLGWIINNPDNGIGWVLSPNLQSGASGIQTKAAFMAHYGYGSSGQQDHLYMPPIDLAGIAKPGLAFNVAHAQNPGRVETLKVEVFPNCDLTATPFVLYEKSDPDLNTTYTTNDAFYPNDPNDWRAESVDLQQFKDQSIIVRFTAINGVGNNLFIDNARIIDYNATMPEAKVSFDKATICRLDTVTISGVQSTGNHLGYKWSFGSQSSPTTGYGPGPHRVKYFTPGNKNVRLIVSNSAGIDTLVQVYPVVGPTNANFTFSINANTVTFTNTSTASNDFAWDFGDGTTSTEKSPTHTFATTGTFNVKMTSTNLCNVSEKTVAIIITTIGTEELNFDAGVRIVPNPTSGDFSVEIKNPRPETLRLSLLDAQGRLVKTSEVAVKQGFTKVPFENLALPQGVYQLKILSENGAAQAFRVVVQ